MKVERHLIATRINEILNNPLVRPDIASLPDGSVDVSTQVADLDNILLVGDFGCCFFLYVMPGVFEVHSACLPEGRGSWMKDFVNSVLQWMFTRSNAWEITTRIPHGHIAAKALAVGAGFRLEFTREDQCLFRGEKVHIDIYRLDLMDWVERSEWALEAGAAFHDQLHTEAKRLAIITPAHEDDPQHNRVAGAAIEMVRNGQVVKGALFYERWRYLARHAAITIVSETPPVIGMDIGHLEILPVGIRVTLP